MAIEWITLGRLKHGGKRLGLPVCYKPHLASLEPLTALAYCVPLSPFPTRFTADNTVMKTGDFVPQSLQALPLQHSPRRHTYHRQQLLVMDGTLQSHSKFRACSSCQRISALRRERAVVSIRIPLQTSTTARFIANFYEAVVVSVSLPLSTQPSGRLGLSLVPHFLQSSLHKYGCHRPVFCKLDDCGLALRVAHGTVPAQELEFRIGHRGHTHRTASRVAMGAG